MKTQLDPQSERFLEYVERVGLPVEVPEKSATSCRNRMIMLKLAALYGTPLHVPKGVGRAWQERRKLMTALQRDFAKIGPRLHKLKQLQAELVVYYEETGTALLVKDYEIPSQDKVGSIYDLESAIEKFLDFVRGSGARLPNPMLTRQYAIYLMVAYYRKITNQPKRVFLREIEWLINSVAYSLKGGFSVVDQEGVRDAYRRFRKTRPNLADRIDSDPMKYIRKLLQSPY